MQCIVNNPTPHTHTHPPTHPHTHTHAHTHTHTHLCAPLVILWTCYTGKGVLRLNVLWITSPTQQHTIHTHKHTHTHTNTHTRTHTFMHSTGNTVDCYTGKGVLCVVVWFVSSMLSPYPGWLQWRQLEGGCGSHCCCQIEEGVYGVQQQVNPETQSSRHHQCRIGPEQVH